MDRKKSFTSSDWTGIDPLTAKGWFLIVRKSPTSASKFGSSSIGRAAAVALAMGSAYRRGVTISGAASWPEMVDAETTLTFEGRVGRLREEEVEEERWSVADIVG